MSCIPDPAIEAHLRADPKNFIGTRWTWGEPVFRDTGAFYNEHVVECLHVDGEFIHIATAYSDPFQHHAVPVEDFFSKTGSFIYIGRAKDFSWVTSSAYFEHHEILYRIDGIEGKYIRCTPEWRLVEEGTAAYETVVEGPLNRQPANVNLVYDGVYLSRMVPVGLETMQILIQELTTEYFRTLPLRNTGVSPGPALPLVEEPKEELVVGAERYDRVEPV